MSCKMRRELEASRLDLVQKSAASGEISVKASELLSRMDFALSKHKKYIQQLDSNQSSFEYVVTEHLRLSGVYWAMSALEVWGAGDEYDKGAVADWVMQCYNDDDGSFGGNVGHDGHMLYTLSGVQLLAMCGRLDNINGAKTAAFVSGLQQADGSFAGDEWGEVDTRFSYCALCCCSILGKADAIDVPLAVQFILSCQNFDGGFGACPGAESHGGQVFTCVAVLAMAQALDQIDADRLGWWLCERQCDSGGLNGRPEKQSDVCYSWWNLTALQIIGRLHWINTKKLTQFILECQDVEDGGIADRPGNVADVYHTFFGSAGLSLLGSLDKLGVSHCPIDPVFALPKPLVASLGLQSQQLAVAASVAPTQAAASAPASQAATQP